MIAAALGERGEATFRVRGGSMRPFLRDGALVRLRRAEGFVGDVVARATGDGRLLVHRLVGREGGRLITRGDALDVPDPPLAPAEFVGVVVAVAARDGAWRRVDGKMARACGHLVGAVLAPSWRAVRRIARRFR